MNVVHRRIPVVFHSPKASGPILHAGPTSQDLLIQASLDYEVVSITYVHSLPFAGRAVRIAAPRFDTDGGAYVALVNGGHPDREPDDVLVRAAIAAAGLEARSIAPDDVSCEPLATTARVIWRQRHLAVDPGMRLGLRAAFAFETSMTVHELCERVPGPRDPCFAIMSLACAGELHLDLSQGFDRNTVVRGPR